MAAVLTSPTASIPPLDLSFLWLEITAKCNLECVHCYADSGPRQNLFGRMSTEHWLTVIHDSAAAGCRQVQFIGGEPTLHPSLSEMISFAADKGYTFIEVFTNGTMLNDGLLAKFVEHGVHIATSFYSDEAAIHDSITLHQGSFDRTVINIKRYIDAGLLVRAGIIETQKNAGHAERAKRFLEDIGVSEIRIDSQRGVGRGATQSISSLNPMAELCGECWKGKLCITSSGRTYPCVFSRFADLGNVKEGVRNVLDCDALAEFRDALKKYTLERERKNKTSSYEDDRMRPAAANNAMGSCGPYVICNPDLECAPNCIPGSSKCVPADFCVPDRSCAPDLSCHPDISAARLIAEM